MSVFIGYPSFMAYQMMKGKKGNNDGFPSIPGMIARYSALGLTNEQMKENPVWVDKTGNGHDLQLKNFAWGGMSGVGGYVTNKEVYEYDLNKYSYVFIPSESKVHDFYVVFELTGYDESFEDGFNLDVRSTTQGLKKRVTYTKNGIYTFQYKDEEGLDNLLLVGYNGNGGERSTFTVKFLPLYPGFILGDGVDDFAVTEKELNFEDTYTVYTAFIPFQDDPARTMSLCGKDRLKDFYMYYSSLDSIGFFSVDKSVSVLLSNGFNLIVCKKASDKMLIKNLITGKVAEVSVDDLIYNPGLYYLWRSATIANYSKTAIAGQIIDNGHFTTDEEDEKVLNWHKKQYPWLFPDQAWTVTGKTNEDADRATIANITGNGNDLVLSNFGFAEGSGYGLYYQYFGNEFKATNGEIEGGGWNIIDNYNISHDKRIPINSIGKCFWGNKALVNGIKLRFKLTGMTEGDVLAFGYAAIYDLTYTSDGIYAIDLPPVDKSYGFSLQSSLTENLPTTPVTIELLPFEYEGYLVTDGVDDKIVSAKSIAFTDTWTIITDAIFLGEKVVSAGILVKDIFGVSNLMEYGRVEVSVKGGVLLKVPTPSIKAICSDGRIYDADWNEYQAEPGTIKVSEGKLYIGMWYNGMQFCSIAFKNIATYNGYALSKDDCIKAYNYLQTLKAK